jgi:Domain of unknown function (DUF4375)
MATYWSSVEPIWDVINIDSPESFLMTLAKVRPELGLLYAAHFCQSEVCNGGFTQFFWNSTGVLGPEAVKGFAAIGQEQTANIVQRAMDMLCQPYSRDRASRQMALKSLLPENEEPAEQNETEAEGTEEQELLALIAQDRVPGYRRVEAFSPLEEEFYIALENGNGGFELAADKYAERIGAQEN